MLSDLALQCRCGGAMSRSGVRYRTFSPSSETMVEVKANTAEDARRTLAEYDARIRGDQHPLSHYWAERIEED